jgi:hypothetical protein
MKNAAKMQQSCFKFASKNLREALVCMFFQEFAGVGFLAF